MRNKSTKSKRNYQKIIFMSFIIFCVGVLAWDIANNGFSAAFGDLPAAAQIDDIPEPNESSDNSTLTDTSANTNNTTCLLYTSYYNPKWFTFAYLYSRSCQILLVKQKIF